MALAGNIDVPSLISYLLAVGLLILGSLFILASPYNLLRLPIGLIFIVCAISVVIVARRRQRQTQLPAEARVYASGKLNVKELKCPKCGGSLQYDEVRKLLVCPYCKAVSQVEEEPLW